MGGGFTLDLGPTIGFGDSILKWTLPLAIGSKTGPGAALAPAAALIAAKMHPEGKKGILAA